MLGLIAVAFIAGLVVAFALPRYASFARHLGLGALVGAAGLPLVMLISALLLGERPATAEAMLTLAIIAFYGAILGATGGSVVWVLGRLPLVANIFIGRPGLDPEGDGMRREALEARRRQALRRVEGQVEQELAAGEYDTDLWEQAGEEVGRKPHDQRRRYTELRADRIVHGPG